MSERQSLLVHVFTQPGSEAEVLAVYEHVHFGLNSGHQQETAAPDWVLFQIRM